MNKALFFLGIAVVVVVWTMWNKPPAHRTADTKERVNTWENEGGQVPGIPPPRDGR
jgi:hypothetical protein